MIVKPGCGELLVADTDRFKNSSVLLQRLQQAVSRTQLDAAMREFSDLHRTYELALLRRRPAGCVAFIELPMLSVSSTDIRIRLRRGESVEQLLPSVVSTYIKEHQLYRGPSCQ